MATNVNPQNVQQQQIAQLQQQIAQLRQQNAQLQVQINGNQQWMQDVQQAQVAFAHVQRELNRYQIFVNNAANGPAVPIRNGGQPNPTLQNVQNVIAQELQNVGNIPIARDPNLRALSVQNMTAIQNQVNGNNPNLPAAINTARNFSNNNILPRSNALINNINRWTAQQQQNQQQIQQLQQQIQQLQNPQAQAVGVNFLQALANLPQPAPNPAPVQAQGANVGVNAGVNQGANAGVNAGANQGANAGVNAGVNQGANAGFNAGVNQGANAGVNAGANQGANAGANQGANAGVNANRRQRRGSRP